MTGVYKSSIGKSVISLLISLTESNFSLGFSRTYSASSLYKWLGIGAIVPVRFLSKPLAIVQKGRAHLYKGGRVDMEIKNRREEFKLYI